VTNGSSSTRRTEYFIIPFLSRPQSDFEPGEFKSQQGKLTTAYSPHTRTEADRKWTQMEEIDEK
jgi:hypothetical protein